MEIENSTARKIAIWLIVCSAMTALIISVGGITRLTRSGLSITEWKPISGIVPPLTIADWEDSFQKYKETPEYQKVNHGMSLDEYKNIFWWEFIHRAIARAIGLVFLFPFLWFLIRRQIPRAMVIPLIILFLIGGFQGFLGWYMVKSGLVNDVKVSHYRLTSHLGLAVFLYIAMLSTALHLFKRKKPGWDFLRTDKTLSATFFVIIFMILSGAMVAGMRAGKLYNTFPLMNGEVIPTGIMSLSPWYANFTENPALLQFFHRSLAYVAVLLVILSYIRVKPYWHDVSTKKTSYVLLVAVLAQFLLGVTTLLLAVPVFWAAMHQLGAIILLTIILILLHKIHFQKMTSAKKL